MVLGSIVLRVKVEQVCDQELDIKDRSQNDSQFKCLKLRVQNTEEGSRHLFYHILYREGKFGMKFMNKWYV
jgi:hypothetical protein